jgi:hypothetical protein
MKNVLLKDFRWSAVPCDKNKNTIFVHATNGNIGIQIAVDKKMTKSNIAVSELIKYITEDIYGYWPSTKPRSRPHDRT